MRPSAAGHANTRDTDPRDADAYTGHTHAGHTDTGDTDADAGDSDAHTDPSDLSGAVVGLDSGRSLLPRLRP